jgi:hypothetical protein
MIIFLPSLKRLLNYIILKALLITAGVVWVVIRSVIVIIAGKASGISMEWRYLLKQTGMIRLTDNGYDGITIGGLKYGI